MSAVRLWTEFDASTLQFGPVEKNKMGGSTVSVWSLTSAGARDRVRIQTPPLALPFGVSTFEDKNTGKIDYSIDASFRGADANPKLADFLARVRKLDDVLLDAAVAKSKEWFGKTLSKDLVKAFLRPLVKETDRRDANGNPYPPVLKTKVRTSTINPGEILTKFYDKASRAEVGLDYVTKGSTVELIISLSNVWFVGKSQFGVSWKVEQVRVVSRPQLQGPLFIDDGEDDAPEAALPDGLLDG